MSREVLQTKLHVYFAHKDKNSDPVSRAFLIEKKCT